MTDSYFAIMPDEQQAILGYAAEQLGRSENVLEKDIWVCWVLKTLFSLTDAPPMAFKGGTSLSKVFNIINRFSEDIDITLDYRHFANGFDPFWGGHSKNKLRKLSEQLKQHVQQYANDIMVPHIRSQLNKLPSAELHSIRIDDSGEKIWMSYPSVTEEIDEYLRSEVLIELGGRNVIDPNELHVVKPYVSDLIPELEFPTGQVIVLSPERTFWEKATLIHVECRRGLRESAARLSRHWYDLVMLARHEVGYKAMCDRTLLEDVIRHKSVFFNASYAGYEECLAGRLLLLPNSEGLSALKADYQNMISAEMIYGIAPSFGELIEVVKQIEYKINAWQ
ncbi:nucleotidyl transferase AbiEii/AbiGii toxin family protein [Xenorhabdus griffiniae]|uniref:Nucleotidyl transferase AbiEii/AbiGii toxin family protein n=1 Tax=Xenorhabdus griffiniae TaxID=351672 RepID=A0ABY9XGB7_9GAMM|nr:nucleotidyl transferase AbiEii/AbiGii toxin family protein [Xenorhabdus griffiniae]MBD1226327.1 nucleotidyl transferase AbiEii/AbiGii toxin family protein [Xenorhabdus griffiniae]MBE8586605.1 nucleotidyl transferase AbiEii/AbiGii toxin family protein [Xenorhabdus griffiniae]WMV71924.1 nucleotidyl transferase AbiEii/AbiGii toxin family protein [Xenorhabdus griffiniae]WNH01601.1 nucleotidyl transferase AbiEii/AbiGii toxin family protein [Xenorhabdus griffiniae]